jgi:tetratricopeptide (TPR) repeat protein
MKRPAAASARPASDSRIDWLPARVDLAIAAALVLVTVVLYAPVRTHEFLNYDDNEYVTEHPHVPNGLTWAGVRWALTGVHQATWHPLTSLSHLLDVELFGLDAGAHLLVNVALHALASAVLFLTLAAMTGARWPSAWVAAVFAWHPLHVESVAWVSERKDVLSGLCWMLTLAAHLRFARQPTWGRWAAVVAIFAAGLLAKPMLVTLPFVLLLLDWWPLGRLRDRATAIALVREKLPLFALAAAVSVLTVVAQRSAGALAATLASTPLAYRAGNAAISYVTYLWKTVWPTGLAVFYPAPAHLSAWDALGAALVLVSISVAVAVAWRRRPFLAVGWLWFLGTLVPVIGLVRQGDQAMADRFTYLPAIGLYVMVAWGALSVPGLRRNGALRTAGPGAMLATAAAATLVALLVVTAAQIPHWQNSLALFSHAVAVTRDNHVAHSNLGIALTERGRHDEAMAHYARAVAIAPGYAKAHLNLGRALARAGRGPEAEAEYAEAVRLDPGSAVAAYNLGLARAERGALDAAIAEYRRALAIEPRYAKAANNLGWALAAKGDASAAVAAYERALAIDPALVAAHNNLAVTLADLGRMDEAIQHATAAVTLAPTEPRAHANRGALLAQAGRTTDAIPAFREALRLDPKLTEVRLDLAATLAATGNRQAAITEYRIVLRERPNDENAAAALATLERQNENGNNSK